jgi:hypothetical protein
MTIPLEKLRYTFKTKPLLVGGKAKEYYGIRKAGDDIDFIITKEDYNELVKLYPHNTEDLFGDLGVKVHGFELWTSICLFDYEYLSKEAIETENYKIISLEKILLLTALAMKEEKYKKDLELIVQKILDIQYKK